MSRIKARTSSLSTWSMGALCVLMLVGIAAAGNFFGAIFTTMADGTTVNGNIYESKDDVYLNGGPQNANSQGLPDGDYYFQVTDPSGAVLLSSDDISCRQVAVVNGKMAGATGPACQHANGTFNGANGTTPVQLIPYDDTPNPGGEYKAWLTPVGAYSPDPDNPNCSARNSNVRFGFCDSDSKTDNFKVKKPEAAYVRVCKFNDQNYNGTQEQGEPMLAHWPLTATGVDAGDMTNQTVQTQTDDFGCVSFAVSEFPNGSQTVTLTEGAPGIQWTQTAPLDGSYNNGASSVSGGVTSVTLHPGDDIHAPDFGNFDFTGKLLVTKDANPSNKFTWEIQKSVDKNEIDTSAGSGVFNYTVTVSHDSGTGWVVTGDIEVSNSSPVDISGITVTDAVDNGGTCTITDENGGLNESVKAGEHIDVPYKCTYANGPADPPQPGTNTATASWAHGTETGTAAVDFSNAVIDGSVTVTDPLGGGTLGTVTYTDSSPATFTYSYTVEGRSGTCVSKENTATFTTDTTSTSGSDSQTVRVCVGADPTVSKTATASFNSNIQKDVDKTTVKQVGGSATFNYSVTVTESGWNVSGNITVSNSNDWEAISVNLADALDVSGGSCTISGGNVQSVPASGSISPAYSCSFSSAPSAASGSNTATVTWDKAAAFTPDDSATGSASFSFGSLTVTDTFNGTPTTLGTIAGNTASTTYNYSHTIAMPQFNCTSYTNTARIVETDQSASQTVTVCGPLKTGALTMGFWQNKNGQGIIKGGASTAGVCNSGAWLRTAAPFQDLSPTASCAGVASYATTIIKAANSSGASMNAMLKAQMLATALDVYFSDPALGGNQIGAPSPIGGVSIDLTNVKGVNVSSAFGGATSMTVSQVLAFAAGMSNAGGSFWYGNVKSIQELAKNTFDAINNQWVFAP